jgi:hypothetical protein
LVSVFQERLDPCNGVVVNSIEDLTALENWENGWQMSFNPSKCTVIRVAPNKSKTVIPTNYQLHGHTLEIGLLVIVGCL